MFSFSQTYGFRGQPHFQQHDGDGTLMSTVYTHTGAQKSYIVNQQGYIHQLTKDSKEEKKGLSHGMSMYSTGHRV